MRSFPAVDGKRPGGTGANVTHWRQKLGPQGGRPPRGTGSVKSPAAFVKNGPRMIRGAQHSEQPPTGGMFATPTTRKVGANAGPPSRPMAKHPFPGHGVPPLETTRPPPTAQGTHSSFVRTTLSRLQ